MAASILLVYCIYEKNTFILNKSSLNLCTVDSRVNCILFQGFSRYFDLKTSKRLINLEAIFAVYGLMCHSMYANRYVASSERTEAFVKKI